jgi:hypothetical protein
MENLWIRFVKVVDAFPSSAKLALAVFLAAPAMYQTAVSGESPGRALYHPMR